MRMSAKAYIRKIDFVFYNEEEIRQQIMDERNKAAAPSMRNGSGVSDPTAKEAIYNIVPLEGIKVAGRELKWPEKWVEVIDKTYDWSKKQAGKLRYKIAKMKYTGKDYRKICEACHVSARFYYTLIENFRKYAANRAAKLRLITEEEYEETFL